MAKRTETTGQRIKRIRSEIGGIDQATFGQRLGVGQGTISAWERDDPGRGPSAQIYFGLARVAPKLEDRLFFLRKSGVTEEVLMEIAEKISTIRSAPALESEIYRVRVFRRTAQGNEDTPDLYPFSRADVQNRASTICLEISETAASAAVPTGTRILLDTSMIDAEDLSSFWDECVLVDVGADSRGLPPLPTMAQSLGLSIGWLRYKQVRPVAEIRSVEPQRRYLVWIATVGGFSDSATFWEPVEKSLYIGDWYSVPEPRASSELEWDVYEMQFQRDAPKRIRLIPSCRILGRVIAWLPPRLNARG